ncbi:MAG: hypothetical protein IIC59_01670 [Proteobacteria bacterium]|nr:hypothetical protein [Pseudomonadota bacterium]
MPTKQDLDDAELSVLLSKAEPPKSPQHVDDYILAHARTQAGASEPGSRWRFLVVSKSWLNQNWFSAVATISVAVVAVSLSFQNFVAPSVDEIALTSAAGRGIADFDVELDATAPLRVQATQSLLSVNELSVEELPVAEEASPTLALKVDNANLPTAPQSLALNDSPVLENRRREANLENSLSPTAAASSTAAVSSLERAERSVAPNDAIAGIESLSTSGLDRDSSTAAAVDTLNASRLLAANAIGNGVERVVADELAQARVAPSVASVASSASLQEEVGDIVVEELVAVGLVRSNPQAAASPAAATRPGLDTLLAADTAAQQSLIEMLTRVLIGLDQNEIAMRAPLEDLIAPLISAYNQLADEPTIAAAADRYRDVRLNFTAFDLPESLAQLMDFLQALEYPEPR